MTWSPFLSEVTPAPVSTTMPAPSCPRIAGNSPSGSAPDSVNASVWQTPVALISTSASPARGPSRSTVVTSSVSPALFAIAALTFTRCFVLSFAAQHNCAVGYRRLAALRQHLEVDDLGAIAQRLARERANGDVRRHQHHAGEAARDAGDARRIATRLEMHDTRDRQRERRGAVQNEFGQAGTARKLDIGVNRIPDPRAFGVGVRESARDMHLGLGARPVRTFAELWQFGDRRVRVALADDIDA